MPNDTIRCAAKFIVTKWEGENQISVSTLRSVADAEANAERRAKEQPGLRFHVFQAISSFETIAPQIRKLEYEH